MKLNHNTKLFLIGLSPLAAGMVMHYALSLVLILGTVLGVAFLVIWYKAGKDTVLTGRKVSESMIILNAPAIVFLVSAFVHEIILQSYMGIVGSLTQSFFVPLTLLSGRITRLLGQFVSAFTGEIFVSRVFYADVISFILLIISFILGVKAGEKKKY